MYNPEQSAAVALRPLRPGGAGPANPPPAADPGQLAAVEEAVIARAGRRRRLEFALGRRCARQALAGLGAAADSIPVGEDGGPLWPAGVVGSLTHCDGFVGAAVARRRDLAALGIDAEGASELSAELRAVVCTPPELDRLVARGDCMPWGKLAFSAKESVYKCLAPMYRSAGMRPPILEPRDLAVDLRIDGTFTATSPHLDLSALRGRWCATSAHVLTVATLQ